MNLAETTRLLAMIRAACPGMTIVEGMPHAWQELLADVHPEDAAEGTMRLLRQSRQIPAPADIRQAVGAIRRERLDRADKEGLVPDADPDDVPAYLAALREGRFRAASPADGPVRDVAALTAGAFRRVDKPYSPGGATAKAELAAHLAKRRAEAVAAEDEQEAS